MSTVEQVFRRTKTITFDCYGTLVDWRTGLTRCFGELFGPVAGCWTGLKPAPHVLFESYLRAEAEVEATAEPLCGGYRSYRQVVSTAVRRVAERFGYDLPPGRADLLAETLPDWPLFADTNDALVRLKQRYRLGVLSNIDRDLFSKTARHFEVAFDFVVTAEDVKSYKPALGHFQRLLMEHGGREDVLHVAQSLFHDGVPTTELGIAYVWINRYREANETAVRPLAEYPGLASFAETACGVSSVE